jgi:hypothetical protein
MDLYLAVNIFSATGFLSESINFTHICCDIHPIVQDKP